MGYHVERLSSVLPGYGRAGWVTNGIVSRLIFSRSQPDYRVVSRVRMYGVWELLYFSLNFLVLTFTLICLFQLFASVCDKRKHQAFVILLIAAMSVQGIANLNGQFVSTLQIRLLCLVESALNLSLLIGKQISSFSTAKGRFTSAS